MATRREFLKALVTVGATAIVARRAIVEAIASNGLISFDNDILFIRGITLLGSEKEPRGGAFDLYRVGNQSCLLLRFCLNAYGGIVHWDSGPDGYIAVTRKHMVDFKADFDGAVAFHYRLADGTSGTKFFPVVRKYHGKRRRITQCSTC